MHHLSELVNPLRNLTSAISRPRKSSAVSLDWDIESSPTIILGTGSQSLPPILSGTISMTVNKPLVEICGFTAVLKAHTVQKKPARNRCAECKHRYFDVHHWSFLSQHTVLQSGTQTFPFSTLIPDHLPASMKSPLLSVSYEFHAEVHFKSPKTPTNTPQSTSFNRILTVRRHTPVPNCPLQATRSFQSAGIQVETSINSIVCPTEINNAFLSLSGLLVSPGNGQDDYIWRLWKGSWKLQETIRALAVPCNRHRCLTDNRRENSVRRKTRTLCNNDIENTWKVHEAEGTVEVEFGFNICQQSVDSERDYSYDTKSLDGTEVIHTLVIDLVFVKENFPHGQLHSAIRTGVAKILTLSYRVFMVDDQSTGPGWAVESAPCYQDERSSPPGYLEGGAIASLERCGPSLVL